VELKIASETDKEIWDAVVDRSPDSSIYHTWKWLKLAENFANLKKAGIKSGAIFYPVMLMERGSPVGICPFFIFKAAGFSSCYSPPPGVATLYLGPLFPDIETMNEGKKQTFLVDVQKEMDRFIKKDRKSTSVQINTAPGFEDCRSYTWEGYTVEPRFTYYIDLSKGTESIWNSFSKHLRYWIRRATKEGIIVTDGNKEDAYHIYQLLQERDRVQYTKEFVGSVYDSFYPDHMKIFIAKAGSERLSGTIALLHKDKVSAWIGSPKYSYNGISPNELIMWEIIQWACEQGYKTYEIMGADECVLFPFKKKFNGRIIQFYQMKWFSPFDKLSESPYIFLTYLPIRFLYGIEIIKDKIRKISALKK
jgi:hypothetical protein